MPPSHITVRRQGFAHDALDANSQPLRAAGQPLSASMLKGPNRTSMPVIGRLDKIVLVKPQYMQ